MTLPDAMGGPHISDPTDLTREDYRAAFKRTLTEVKEDDVPGLAGGVAFKIFLSLFPSLLAAVAVFSIVTTPAEMAKMIGEARGFVPDAAIKLLQAPLEDLAKNGNRAAGWAAVIGVLTGLWAASGAAVSLMKALSRAYDVAETRKFVRQRIIGLALIVALLVSLVAVVLLLVVGRQVQTALLGNVVAPFSWVLASARFLLAVAVLTVLFAFVYWIGPNREQPSWVWISPGAVVGVLGWLVASGAFTVYAQTAPAYNKTYSTIVGVTVLLIWLQLSMLTALLGAEFNAEIERTRALYARVGEGAGFATPEVTAGVVPPDPVAGTALLVQAETAAHSVDPPADVGGDDHVAPTVAQTAPDLADDTRGGGQARKAGALAAAVMAGAVFLGFARKRGRR